MPSDHDDFPEVKSPQEFRVPDFKATGPAQELVKPATKEKRQIFNALWSVAQAGEFCLGKAKEHDDILRNHSELLSKLIRKASRQSWQWEVTRWLGMLLVAAAVSAGMGHIVKLLFQNRGGP